MDRQSKKLWNILKLCWKIDPGNRIKASQITVALENDALTREIRDLESDIQTRIYVKLKKKEVEAAVTVNAHYRAKCVLFNYDNSDDE
jgi:hypothetical protein